MRHVIAKPSKKKPGCLVPASMDASVDLAVGHHHLSIDYLLPCSYWPCKAACHASQRKGSVNQDLFLNILRSCKVRSTSPTNPACYVQKHKGWSNDTTLDARFTCCDDAWQSVCFSTESLPVHRLTPSDACNLLCVAIPNCRTICILLLPLFFFVNLVLVPLVELLVVLAKFQMSCIFD